MCSLLALLLCSITHYDITMTHDIARDAPCSTRMDDDVAKDIHYDVTKDKKIKMKKNDVTMDNDVVICT